MGGGHTKDHRPELLGLCTPTFSIECWPRRASLSRGRRLGGVGLELKPLDDLGSPVAHGPSDPEAARTGSEMAPVAQRGNRYAHDAGNLRQGEEVVTGVRGTQWLGATQAGGRCCSAWVVVMMDSPSLGVGKSWKAAAVCLLPPMRKIEEPWPNWRV